MKVVSHTDVHAAGAGGTIELQPDAVVTPLAEEEARRLGVTLRRSGSGGVSPSLVRAVTQRVVSRLGPDADPVVLEAVIRESVEALAASGAESVGREEVAPGIDFCQMCLEQERSRSRTRAVITTTGRNQKGIVARVTTRIFELGGDIVDISQTLVGDYFTMIVVVDTATLAVSFADFKSSIEETVHALGLQCMTMHEDVLSSLHRV
jgi:ACT domain-containing protein